MKTSCNCWEVKFLTSIFALTIGAKPTTATLWSVIAEASIPDFSSAKISEFPIWKEPAATCVKPTPEPPPCTVTWTPVFFAINSVDDCCANGWRAVEPPAIIFPDRALSEELELLDDEPFDEPQAAKVNNAPAVIRPTRIFFFMRSFSN